MGAVHFISDPHFGHHKVLKFENYYRSKVMGGITTIEEHDTLICKNWHDKVSKKDKVFVLGDLGFGWRIMKDLPGMKVLLLGNHDEDKARNYLEVFDDIIGPLHYKGFWLSHHPIHVDELYDRPNIHGHTHSKGIADPMYINMSIEMNAGVPVNFQDVRSMKYTTWDRVNKSFEELTSDT